MRMLITLIRREFWEQRNVFFTLPIILGGVVILASICGFFLSFNTDLLQFSTNQTTFPPELLAEIFFSIGIPFSIVLWLTVFYYFLGTLYDDRKDGSILFWQSMPITQTQTLISKLVAGFIIAPICALFCMIVTQLILMVLTSFFLMVHPIISWTALWHPISMFKAWFAIVIALIKQAFWLLPLLMWCMLCSAYAKKAPALRAFVPIIVIMILELFFAKKAYFTDFIFSHIGNAGRAWHGLYIYFQQQHVPAISFTASSQAVIPPTLNLLIGIIIAVLFIFLAGILRSRCYDFEK